MPNQLWRGFFISAGVLVLVGGPRHPGGTIPEMLAHPDWVPAHASMLAAYVAFVAGLVLFGRRRSLPPRTALWLELASLGTALQAVEMAFHTAAYVDLENLLAGRSTPILTTHMWMTPVFYPLFGITIGGFIIASARARAMASPWVAWIGVLGVIAQGVAGFLVPLFNVEWARSLFPGVVLFAVWAILAGVWPLRRAAKSLAGDLAEIAQRSAALPVRDDRAADVVLGYDERGLPR